jgi:PAS domain S-box-containing protein
MDKKIEASDYCLQIANQVTAMLAYWDSNQTCRFANNAYRDWFGKTPEEMIGISLKKLLGPLYDKNLPHIKEVLKGKPQTLEREIQAHTGGKRHALANYYPDIDDNGVVKGFFVHVADITGVRNLEIELKASELKFKQLLETAPDAIIIITKTGNIHLANAQVEFLFGYNRQELYGRPIEILIPERFRSNHHNLRTAFSKQPHLRPMGNGLELFGLRKNGEEFPVETSLSPLKINNELLISVSIRDVTWKVEKQNELMRSMDIINRQNKRLLNFTHVVSHNLKTHSINLASIISLLNDATTEQETKKLMEFLHSVSFGFSETVNNLIEIVDLQTEKKIELTQLNLHHFAAKTLDMLDINIKSCKATIKNKIDPATYIDHNPAYLESIIQNFLTNALKYRDPERALIIKLDSYVKQDEVVLRIEDTGRGIDLKKYGDKLFGIYKTFHGNPDAKGVGLFITKYQVEELGGHIDVMSKEGVGTVFTIYFANKNKN